MDKNTARTKIGFEVLSKDNNSITFKRLIPLKHRNVKEARAIELDLTKVTVKYFDKDDLIHLQKIGDGIYRTYVEKNKNIPKRVIGTFIDFVTK
jgi:hypothetical protein